MSSFVSAQAYQLRSLTKLGNRVEPAGKQREAERQESVIWEMQHRRSPHKHPAAISLGCGTEANMTNESDRPVHTRFPPAADLNSDSAARELGLDETLKETFPCSDALSAIPDPLLLEEST